jgi:exonuclease III
MNNPDILLTYNVERGKNLNQIFEWWEDLTPQPDIACFQEFPEPDVKIKNALKSLGYIISFAPALVKNGNVYGQLTAVAPGLKIDQHKVVSFGMSPHEGIYGRIKGFSGQRSALVTNINSGNRMVQVVNIHQPLVANFSERSGNILAVINNHLDSDKPAIFTGDFNNIHINRKKGAVELVDYMARFGFVDTGLNQPTFLKPIAQQLDFVFARGRELVNPRIIDTDLSDHKPLMVEIH